MPALNDSQNTFYSKMLEDYSYSNITTATTTVVKTGAGVVKSICVNSKGTVASAITVYDSLTASGSKIGTIDSLTFLGQVDLGVKFTLGLTIVTTGTVAPDITVIYK